MLPTSPPCRRSGRRLSLAALGSILSTSSNPLHALFTTPALRGQGGDDRFSIGTDPFALVATDIVDVGLGEAQVEETLDVLMVLIQIVRDQTATAWAVNQPSC